MQRYLEDELELIIDRIYASIKACADYRNKRKYHPTKGDIEALERYEKAAQDALDAGRYIKQVMQNRLLDKAAPKRCVIIDPRDGEELL